MERKICFDIKSLKSEQLYNVKDTNFEKFVCSKWIAAEDQRIVVTLKSMSCAVVVFYFDVLTGTSTESVSNF